LLVDVVRLGVTVVPSDNLLPRFAECSEGFVFQLIDMHLLLSCLDLVDMVLVKLVAVVFCFTFCPLNTYLGGLISEDLSLFFKVGVNFNKFLKELDKGDHLGASPSGPLSADDRYVNCIDWLPAFSDSYFLGSLLDGVDESSLGGLRFAGKSVINSY